MDVFEQRVERLTVALEVVKALMRNSIGYHKPKQEAAKIVVELIEQEIAYARQDLELTNERRTK